jgi:MoxR-like ATPase
LNNPSTAECKDMLDRLHANLERVIKGKSDPLEILVAALATGGSVLMEDVPGVGKTTLAKTLAHSIHAQFNRIQFTSYLLPADILGSSVYNPSSGEFSFHKGPIFSNVLLADEINRVSPRTKSALLEAMSEQQATIEGKRHELPAPFLSLPLRIRLSFTEPTPCPKPNSIAS